MRTIWKYALRGETTEISMPRGAEVLHVSGAQAVPVTEALCHLWAEIPHPDVADAERRTFLVIGTGHEVPAPRGALKYIGTAHSPGGLYVWHVYEKLR